MYWTDTEEKDLRDLCYRNASWDVLIEHFPGRSKDSIEKKIKRIGVPLPAPTDPLMDKEAIYIDKENTFLWGVSFCQHRPMHDERAVAVGHKIFKAAGVNGLWDGGDLMDLAGVSYFASSADYGDDLQDEFDRLIKYFDWRLKFYGDTVEEYIWQKGNHELRIGAYLRDNAPKLRSLRCLRLEELSRVEEFNIKMIDGPAILAEDTFVIKHGVSTGEYAGKQELTREGRAGLCSHNHRMRSHSVTERNRRPKTWYHGGCLLELPPRYAKKDTWMSWQQGVNLVRIEGEHVSVEQIPIYNGEAFWAGKLFTAD